MKNYLGNDEIQITEIAGWWLSILAVMIFLWLVLFVATITSANGEGAPFLITVAGAGSLTFGHRACWLGCHKHHGYQLLEDPSAFAPERTAVLGVVLIFCAVAMSVCNDGVLPSDSKGAEWMAGLMTTVPLLSVYSGSWKKLQVWKKEVGTLTWPSCKPNVAFAFAAEKQ